MITLHWDIKGRDYAHVIARDKATLEKLALTLYLIVRPDIQISLDQSVCAIFSMHQVFITVPPPSVFSQWTSCTSLHFYLIRQQLFVSKNVCCSS